MYRRAYLGAAAAGLTAFAGCSAASASNGPPEVPKRALADDWTQVVADAQDPAFEQSVGPVTLTASIVTRLYENETLRAAVRERTLGQVDTQLATFFASRISFDPDLTDVPGGVGQAQLLDTVESQARAAFESRLRSSGLADLERTGGGSMTVDSGAEARRTDYSAAVGFDDFSFSLTDGEDLTVNGGEVTVAGHLATWVAEDSVLLAGGAYPGENFARTIETSPSEAIDVTVDVDLGFDPAAYREELFSLVRSVR